MLFEESLSILEALYRENPSVANYLRNLVSAHERLGLVYGRIEERKKGAEYFQQAIALQEELVERHPETMSYRRTLVRLLQGLAEQQRVMKELDRAQATYEKAVEVSKQLLPEKADSVSEQLLLIRTLGDLGAIFRLKRDLDSARRSYNEAIQAIELLREADPESLDYRIRVGNLYNQLAAAENEHKNRPEAVAASAEAMLVFRSVLETEAEHANGRFGLYTAHWMSGLAHYHMQSFHGAADDWGEARKLAPAEHVTFATQWHGYSLGQAGQHVEAAKVAESLQTGTSLKFYYKLPFGPAILKHNGARILAGADSSSFPINRNGIPDTCGRT